MALNESDNIRDYGVYNRAGLAALLDILPTQTPRFKSSTQSKGFTLIEVMVVVVIIAVMSALVSISFGSNNDRLARLQADRFMAVVNEVRDEAVISGESFALLVDEKTRNYSFLSTRVQESNDAITSALFKAREVDEGVELDWDVFATFDDEDSDPKVLISSLGEITPFELSFEGDEKSVVVFVNDEGLLEQRQQNRLAR